MAGSLQSLDIPGVVTRVRCRYLALKIGLLGRPGIVTFIRPYCVLILSRYGQLTISCWIGSSCYLMRSSRGLAGTPLASFWLKACPPSYWLLFALSSLMLYNYLPGLRFSLLCCKLKKKCQFCKRLIGGLFDFKSCKAALESNFTYLGFTALMAPWWNFYGSSDPINSKYLFHSTFGCLRVLSWLLRVHWISTDLVHQHVSHVESLNVVNSLMGSTPL